MILTKPITRTNVKKKEKTKSTWSIRLVCFFFKLAGSCLCLQERSLALFLLFRARTVELIGITQDFFSFGRFPLGIAVERGVCVVSFLASVSSKEWISTVCVAGLKRAHQQMLVSVCVTSNDSVSKQIKFFCATDEIVFVHLISLKKKTKQNKAKQSKTKQNKTKRLSRICFEITETPVMHCSSR